MKEFIQSVTVVLAVLVMFASCAKSTAETFGVNDIYLKITESAAMPAETVELAADDLTDYYGIEVDKVSEFAAVQDACGYKDEIVIIKADDNTAAKEIEALFNDHVEYQKNSMKNYDPEQYKILGSSEVIVNGDYVAMFISGEQGTMAEIFNGFFK